MSRKILAITLVLVLAAGFAAFAAEDEERPLTGTWKSTLTLDPTQETDHGATNPFRFGSDFEFEYNMGGIAFDGDLAFDYDTRIFDEPSDVDDYVPEENGLTDLNFGVDSSIGLLNLSSTIDFSTTGYSGPGSYPYPITQALERTEYTNSGYVLISPVHNSPPEDSTEPSNEYYFDYDIYPQDGSGRTYVPVQNQSDLDYWKSSTSLTLGGVAVNATLMLQDTKIYEWAASSWTLDPGNSTLTQTMSKTPGKSAGVDLEFSGETPGGVSVTVNNLFGMEQVKDEGYAYGLAYQNKWTPVYDSFMKQGVVSGTDFYYPTIPYETGYHMYSDMDYVHTTVALENMSIGCSDYGVETIFSINGFEYTEFEFTLASENLPLSLDGWLTFKTQTTSIYLEPSFTTDWAGFNVYASLKPDLGNNSYEESVLESLEIRGFSITDVELGHVKVSSYTALGDHTVNTMMQSYWGGSKGDAYDELLRIEKLEKYPLDFTLDTWFDMSASDGIFDLGVFDASMSYEIGDEFTVGSGAEFSAGGLGSFDINFEYSF